MAEIPKKSHRGEGKKEYKMNLGRKKKQKQDERKGRWVSAWSVAQ